MHKELGRTVTGPYFRGSLQEPLVHTRISRLGRPSVFRTASERVQRCVVGLLGFGAGDVMAFVAFAPDHGARGQTRGAPDRGQK